MDTRRENQAESADNGAPPMPPRWKRTLISAVILACLGMQGAAYFVPRPAQVYPFIDYPMYNRAHGPPIVTDEKRMFAELADGRRIEVDASYMDIQYFAWRYLIVERILAAPGNDLVEQHRREAWQQVLDAVAAREDAELVALHFEVDEHRIENSELVHRRYEIVKPRPERGDGADGNR